MSMRGYTPIMRDGSDSGSDGSDTRRVSPDMHKFMEVSVQAYS